MDRRKHTRPNHRDIADESDHGQAGKPDVHQQSGGTIGRDTPLNDAQGRNEITGRQLTSPAGSSHHHIWYARAVFDDDGDQTALEYRGPRTAYPDYRLC